MSKKRKAARILKRKPRSWLGVACLLLSLAGLAFTAYETDSEGKITNPGQIFAAFADLNLGADVVARMNDSPTPPSTKPALAKWRRVEKVLDGDTIRLDNGDVVRLIGVDTPESSANRKLREDIYKMGLPVREADLVLLGQAASAFTHALIEGRQCWLEFEKESKDQYGRLLAYVHLEDGRVLNELLIAQGFGKAYLSYSFRYKKRYILLQTEACLAKRGLLQGN